MRTAVEEGGAGVFHQMPAVGDLKRAGKRLAGGEGEASAAVTRDNEDLRLSGEPFLCCRGLPIGKQLDRTTALEVANDRPIALIALPGPVVDADDVRRRRRRAAFPADDPEQRVVAHRHHEAPGETCRRAAAECKREMMHETFETRRATGVGYENVVSEPLGENRSATRRRHVGVTQRNRRAVSEMRITRPDRGKSARRF